MRFQIFTNTMWKMTWFTPFYESIKPVKSIASNKLNGFGGQFLCKFRVRPDKDSKSLN